MMKLLSLAVLAVVALFGTCFGAATTSMTYKADYVLTNPEAYPRGSLTGTVYYRYNSRDKTNAIVRFDTYYYEGSVRKVQQDLYYYKNLTLFSHCTKCTASSFYTSAEQWWPTTYDTSLGGGRYQRSGTSLTSMNLVEFTVDSNNYATYLKFFDGREYTLTNHVTASSSDFEVPSSWNCPKPECRTFADIVFVLDNSASVDGTEWNQMKTFVQNVVKKFTLGATSAAVGVVLFSAPTTSNCGWNKHCYRNGIKYVTIPIKKGQCETKNSEQECNRDATNIGVEYHWRYNSTSRQCCVYADRFVDDCEWGHISGCSDDNNVYVKKAIPLSTTSNDVGSMQKISGNTCQGYGLEMAYHMLFDNNDRCQNGKCPTPIVIAVSDGDDLCRNTTTYWAEELKNRGAYLFEVGVGLESDYDEEYINNISTQLGTSGSSLNVDKFNQMSSIIDQLVIQVCEYNTNSSTTCGADCKGFCACGTCVCPTCSETGSKCNYLECDANNAWNGCMMRDVSCTDPALEETKCYNQWCDDDADDDDDDECKFEKINCTKVLEDGGYHFRACESVECVNGSGCSKKFIHRDDSYCQGLPEWNGGCNNAKCDPTDPSADDVTGCVFTAKDCSLPADVYCSSSGCDPTSGECVHEGCLEQTHCMRFDEEHKLVPLCPVKPCMKVECDNEDNGKPDEIEARCSYTNITCENNNKCLINVCEYNEVTQESKCVTKPRVDNVCQSKNTKCSTFSCNPDLDDEDGNGACVEAETPHEELPCYDYQCYDETGWNATPKCSLSLKCKISVCIHDSVSGEDSCLVTDVSCADKVSVPNECFYPTCNENVGCTVKKYSSSYFDICGNCIRTDIGANLSQQELTNCVSVSDETIAKEGLAAAAIALIVLGAIVIGAAVAGSSVLGTKALIDRAHAATNQSAVSNPLFEEAQTEMSNPAFVGGSV